MKLAMVEEPSAPMTQQYGDGRYSLITEHSRGGMGRILLVHDDSIGRDVALKEVLPELHSPEAEERFLREARLTGQLEHPGIVPVYEVGHGPDQKPYYTMRFVRGNTLRDALNETKTYADRIKLLPHFVDLCHTIAYAHSRGVIHRDLKPGNIMRGEFGETVVLDWGLAKGRDDEIPRDGEQGQGLNEPADAASPFQTADGALLGTASYIAPEQAKGDVANFDERLDVYALGAILYEILTGRPPYEGTSASDILNKALAGPPAPVNSLERQVPPELVAVCERAMARDPDRRDIAAKEMADHIGEFITGRLLRARKARITFLAALYGLGAGLVAAGMAALVAYNWRDIPPHFQVALLVATTLALLGSGLYVWNVSARRPLLGHALVFLGVLMLYVDLLLLCTIYHIPLSGNWELTGRTTQPGAMHENILFLLWAAGAFGIAWLVRSNLIAAVSLGATFLAFAEEFFEFPADPLGPHVYLYPIVTAALFLPAVYRWGNGKLTGMLIVTVTLSCVLVTSMKQDINGPRALFALLTMAAAVFPWGLISFRRTDWRKLAYPALALSVLCVAISAAELSAWRAEGIFFLGKFQTFGWERNIPAAAACLAAVMLWAVVAARGFGSSQLRALSIVFVIVMPLLLAALILGGVFATQLFASPDFFPPGGMLAVFAAANLAVVLLGAAVTCTGLAFSDRRLIWTGVLYVAFMTVMRILEISTSLQYLAVSLVCAGLALIAVVMRLEAHLRKRRLV